jgi:hypothetical protein
MSETPTPGDRVEGFRALPNSPFAEGFEGIVTEVHDPCPIPSVDEPCVVVDTGADKDRVVRLSNVSDAAADEPIELD